VFNSPHTKAIQVVNEHKSDDVAKVNQRRNSWNYPKKTSNVENFRYCHFVIGLLTFRLVAAAAVDFHNNAMEN
jgi:hypothetical protein